MFHFKNLFLVHLFCNSFPSCGSLQLQKMEFHFGLLARQGRIWNRKLSSLTPYYPKTNTSHTGVPGSIPSTSRSNLRAVLTMNYSQLKPQSNNRKIPLFLTSPFTSTRQIIHTALLPRGILKIFLTNDTEEEVKTFCLGLYTFHFSRNHYSK